MDGFEKRREKKKEAILNSALSLFKQYGYNKVTIAEIAKKASVSQVSIYNFFESKENLKFELIKKIMNEHYSQLIRIFHNGESSRERFEKLLTSRIDFFKSFPSHFILETLGNDAQIRESIVRENYDKFTYVFLDFIEEGKKEGIIDDSISRETMHTIIDIIQFYFINNPLGVQKFDNNPQLTNEFFAFLTNAFLKKS